MKTLRTLLALSLLVCSCLALHAQWESMGAIQREEPTNTPMGPDIIKGSPTRVAANADGLAIITAQKTLWRHDGKAWVWVHIPQFAGGLTNQYAFEDIAVHGKTIYVATGDGSIHFVNDVALGWQKLPGGGKAKRLATDTNGQLWMVALDGSVMVYDNESWTAYGNIKARDIAVHDGTPVIAGQGQGYLHVGKDGKWQLLTKDWTGVENLSIDPSTGTLWIETESIWAYTAEGWKKYAEKGKYFDICAMNGVPYALNKDYKLNKGTRTEAFWRTAGALVGTEPVAATTPTPATTTEAQPAVPAAATPDPSAPYLRTAKTTYKTNEYIEVEFGNFEGGVFDWVALTESGKPDDEYGTYKTTGGGKSGKLSFSYAWAGTYELRGYFNNGKEVKARVTITIE